MRVCQQHRVNLLRTKRKRSIVQCLQRFLSLEQATIDQEAPCGRAEKVAGTGDGAGCSAKLDGDAHTLFSAIDVPSTSRRNASARMWSRAMALVGWGTLLVDRSERMPARPNSFNSSGGNSA